MVTLIVFGVSASVLPFLSPCKSSSNGFLVIRCFSITVPSLLQDDGGSQCTREAVPFAKLEAMIEFSTTLHVVEDPLQNSPPPVAEASLSETTLAFIVHTADPEQYKYLQALRVCIIYNIYIST